MRKRKVIVKQPDSKADRKSLVKNAKRDIDQSLEEDGLGNLASLAKALQKEKAKRRR